MIKSFYFRNCQCLQLRKHQWSNRGEFSLLMATDGLDLMTSIDISGRLSDQYSLPEMKVIELDRKV